VENFFENRWSMFGTEKFAAYFLSHPVEWSWYC